MRAVCIMILSMCLAACSLSLPPEATPPEGVLAQPRLFGQVSDTEIQLSWGYLDIRIPGGTLQAPEAFEIWSQVEGAEESEQIAVVNGDVFSWSAPISESAPRIWEVRAVGTRDTRERSNQIMLAPGQGPRYIPINTTEDVSRHYGTWSRDGRQITYAARSDSSQPWILFRQDLYARNTLELAPGLEPDMHPENNNLIFVEMQAGQTPANLLPTKLGIWATGEVSFLNLEKGHYRQPRWSPDGQWLVFLRKDDKGASLYRLPIQSLQDVEPLSFEIPISNLPVLLPSGPLNPEWSVEGEGIYFALYQEKERGYARDLFLGNLNDGAISQVVESPWQDFAPSQSPDGQTLAFVSDRAGIPAIWLKNLDTGELAQLSGQESAPVPTPDTRLAWSPDGKEILFTGQIEGQQPNLYRIILTP